MKIIPKHDWLLVKREKDVERKMGSVIIPTQYKPRFFVWGTIQEAGPGISNSKGVIHPMTLQAGDRILYPKGAVRAEVGMELMSDVVNNYDMVEERSVVGYVRASDPNSFNPLFTNMIGKIINDVSTEKQLDSGIILLSTTAIKNKKEGTDMVKVEVVGVGPGRRTDAGNHLPMAVSVGSKCLVNTWDAWEFTILPNDPVDYVIVKDEEILATIADE